MDERFVDIWVYLSRTPLLWLVLTLVVYQLAYVLFKRVYFNSLLHPVFISIAIIVGLLLLTNTAYDAYFEGAQFIHFLLGPATVALAVPLYSQVQKVRQMAIPVIGALLIGSITAVLFVVLFGKLFGLSDAALISMLPKSITTPIAMGVSEQIGGIPSLTAVLVILTGIIGAILGVSVLNLLRVKDDSIRGFSIGLASHGIGTARAFQISEEAGAFSGLAMGLNGVVTAILIPILARLLGFF